MSNLPPLPAALPPAPRPNLDNRALACSPTTLRAYQDSRPARDRERYLFGPVIIILQDEGRITASFPTFGKHPLQTQWLMRGGYRWTGSGWTKQIAAESEVQGELAWARKLYALLHPCWQPEAEDSGLMRVSGWKPTPAVCSAPALAEA